MVKKTNFREDTKMFDSYSQGKVKCKCGHTNFMVDTDRMICSWCGNYVYKNKQVEFKYTMQSMLSKKNKEKEEER